jgi:hypothetical protein
VTTCVSARRCGPSGAKLGVLTNSRWMARRACVANHPSSEAAGGRQACHRSHAQTTSTAPGRTGAKKRRSGTEAVGGGQEAALVGLQQQLVSQHLIGDRHRRGRLDAVGRAAGIQPHDPTRQDPVATTRRGGDLKPAPGAILLALGGRQPGPQQRLGPPPGLTSAPERTLGAADRANQAGHKDDGCGQPGRPPGRCGHGQKR